MRPLKVGDFFRSLIDKENDYLHVGMIFDDRLGDVMKQSRFTGPRRRDNQAALAHAERRHQIHDPRGVAVWHGLELDPLVWVDRGQFLKRTQSPRRARLLA